MRKIMKKKAIFVDRDGTLNRMVYDEDHGIMDSPRRAAQVELMPGAGRFLKKARDLGYMIVVATNQPAVAKKTLSLKHLDEVNGRLAALLKKDGGRWDAFYCCPHHPGPVSGRPNRFVRKCRCRKPAPGLLLDAAKNLGIDLSESWMIGDGLNDIQAGRNAGCRTILLTRLKLEQIERFLSLKGMEPDAIVEDLDSAFHSIERA